MGESDLERRNWFMANFAVPLQQNYRLTLKPDEVEFWVRELTLAKMTRREIIQTVNFVMQDCKWFPSLYDFHRLRPAKREPYVLPGQPGDLAVRLAKQPLKCGSWEQFVRDATVRGLEEKDMAAAYDKIIAEGEKRGIPELDNMPYEGRIDQKMGKPTVCYQNVGLGGFRQARTKVLAIREAKTRGGVGQSPDEPLGKLSARGKAYVQHMKNIGKYQSFRPPGVSQAINTKGLNREPVV